MSRFLNPSLFFLCLNLGVVYNVFSQFNDFQNWNAITIEKVINKKVSLILDQEVRIENNATQFKSYIPSIGGHYEINKYFKVRGFYRYTYSNTFEDGVETEHRFYADLMARYKIDRFVLGYRARYQIEYADFNRNRWHGLRNRFALKYNIPKTPLMPSVEYEFYYSLNSPVKNSVIVNRYTFGLEYKINETFEFSSYYRIQTNREYFRLPKNKYILGLGLGITI